MPKIILKAGLLSVGMVAAFSVSANIGLTAGAAQILKDNPDLRLDEFDVGPPDDYELIQSGGIVVGERDGNILFMTPNGRYVFTGTMIDAWEQREIKSVAEVRATKNKINLTNIGFMSDKLNLFTIGEGNRSEVAVFIDPLCDYCDALIREAKKIAGTSTDYQFNFFVVPALGERSHELSKKFFCSEDPLGKKVDALLGRSIDNLEQPEKCDLENYDLTLTLATMIGVPGVPYLIHPNGLPTAGTPSNLMYWLSGKQ